MNAENLKSSFADGKYLFRKAERLDRSNRFFAALVFPAAGFQDNFVFTDPAEFLANQFFLCFGADFEGLNHLEEFLVFDLELEDLLLKFLYLLVLFSIAGQTIGGKNNCVDEDEVQSEQKTDQEPDYIDAFDGEPGLFPILLIPVGLCGSVHRKTP